MTDLLAAAAGTRLAPRRARISSGRPSVARYDARRAGALRGRHARPGRPHAGRDRQWRSGVLGRLPASSRTRPLAAAPPIRWMPSRARSSLGAVGAPASISAGRRGSRFPFEDAPRRAVVRAPGRVSPGSAAGACSVCSCIPGYGPWMALRAAILLPFALTAPRPADGFDPCPRASSGRASRHARRARSVPRGWDVGGLRRASALRAGDGCDAGCHARIACVYWRAEHRHPPEALAFHQAAARTAMAARLR